MYKRFIEELVGDISMDFSSEEVIEICDAVTQMSSKLLKMVERRSPFFQSSHVELCGSIAEKTRIWRFTENDKTLMLEFDFLSVLNRLSFVENSFEVTNTCDGFMRVNQKLDALPRFFTEDGHSGTLNIKRVAYKFRTDFMKAAEELCSCLKCDFKKLPQDMISLGQIERTSEYSDACTKCKINCKTGTLLIATGQSLHPVELDATIVYTWKRSVDKTTAYPCEKSRQKPVIDDHMIILVDFLPAIEITERKTEASTPVHKCLLVPKGCKLEHYTCWKISHCKHECQLLKSADPIHRQCYLCLKFILDYLVCDMGQMPEIPKTFLIKSAILLHCAGCKDAQIDKCTLSIMNLLSEAYSKHFLPHTVLKFNLLEKVQDSHLPPEDQLWYEHRNLVMSKFWEYLKKTFEEIESIVTDYNFDKIQTVLKLITLEFSKCWCRTDFRDVFLPDETYFVKILRMFARKEYPTREEMNLISKRTDRYLKERFQGQNKVLYYMCMLRCEKAGDVKSKYTLEFRDGLTEAEAHKQRTTGSSRRRGNLMPSSANDDSEVIYQRN